MVSSAILPLEKGNIDLEKWLAQIEADFKASENDAIRRACAFVQADFNQIHSPLNLPAIEEGIEIANLLLSLDLDSEAVIAAILYPALQYTDLTLEDIQEEFSDSIFKLLRDTLLMDGFGEVHNKSKASTEVDNYRRMLLSMVDDVRVVLLKLAERTIFMRHIDALEEDERIRYSKQCMDIYAPLANRLGILEIKWEIEDLVFRVLHPKEYKHIVKELKERRIDRENFVKDFTKTLKKMLLDAGVDAQIKGRAKHIFSIHTKMQRKDVPYTEIYDAMALRILVNNIEDCYTALSLVHSQWEHVPHEFDDYVATPKPNGYQSIHTVVIVPPQRNVEIQIRTHEMHEANETGGAAHWVYKEGGGHSSYQQKITWLRQLLDWQRDVADSSEIPAEILQGVTSDRVFVFTPDGAVISLPVGATPLDFAYHIHTEVGHKCRGAKVNDKMVPLTYQLQLGDQVDILTSKEASPSRDWLNPQAGYLISPRAKAKIHSWFKKRDFDQNLNDGQGIFQRELKRFSLSGIEPSSLAKRFHLKNGDEVLAAIGAGDIRIPQLSGALQDIINAEKEQEPTIPDPSQFKSKRTKRTPKGILVSGVDDLLTQMAHCCKPLPGEPIVGFITMGRGITVHRKDCGNIVNEQNVHPERIVEVSWGDVSKQHYAVDLVLEAHNRSNLLRDLTRVISDENVNILGINSYTDKNKNVSFINLSVEISGQEQLVALQNQMQQINDIINIRRQ